MLISLMLLGGLAASVGGTLNDDYSLPGTGAQRATDLVEEKFPAMSGADARIVAHDEGPVDGAALAATVDRAMKLPNVTDVSPPLFSDDRRTALISLGGSGRLTALGVIGDPFSIHAKAAMNES